MSNDRPKKECFRRRRHAHRRHSTPRRRVIRGWTMIGGLAMRASATVSGAALTATTNANGKATTTRRAVTPRAAAVSRVGFDGAKTGDADLTLRVARAEVAKGLVHKYVVMVRQNARRVSATTTTTTRLRFSFFSSNARDETGRSVRTTRRESWTSGSRARGPEP